MKTTIFFVGAAIALAWFVWRWRLPPSRAFLAQETFGSAGASPSRRAGSVEPTFLS